MRAYVARECPTVEGFTFYKGMDSYGSDFDTTYGGRTPAQLAQECLQLDCRAFLTTGWLKRALPPQSSWRAWPWPPSECDGMYARNDGMRMACDEAPRGQAKKSKWQIHDS